MKKRQTGYIGIDVGGTKTRLGLFDARFKVLQDVKVKTNDSKTADEYTAVLNSSLDILMKTGRKLGLEIGHIGVGCAGSLNNDGSIKESLNIPFLKDYSFRAVIARFTGANVMVTNDVAAGLYGEYHLGAAVGRKHVIAIFIGTGIGGALLFDGKLYRGANGAAGDIGHYLLPAMGPTGRFKLRALDDVASRTAIGKAAAKLAARHRAPHLLESAGTDPRNINAGALAEAIAKGDESIEKLVRSRLYILGFALSNLVDFLNPDIVVLGGGLADKMSKIVRTEVEAGIRKNSKREPNRVLDVVTTKLKGHAITTGAAKLAADITVSLVAA